jgi:hypothetical protein
VAGTVVGTESVLMLELIVVVGRVVGVVVLRRGDVVVSGAGVVIHFSTSS